MNISICSDHGGLELKEDIKKYLENLGHNVTDYGTDSTDSCDYPDFCFPAAESVSTGKADRGIVICSTGIGMCICANKVKGIRCALVSDLVSAKLTREHNDSNCLALGAKMISKELALEIVDVWMNTEFTGGRHTRRIGKISEYEGEKK